MYNEHFKKYLCSNIFLEDNKNYNYCTLYEHIGSNLQEQGILTGRSD